MIRHLGGTIVLWDHLSTGEGAGAADVSLAGCGVTGCLAGVAGAVGDSFSGGTDSLSGVAGVAGAMGGAVVVVCSTVVGVGGSNSLSSSGV